MLFNNCYTCPKKNVTYIVNRTLHIQYYKKIISYPVKRMLCMLKDVTYAREKYWEKKIITYPAKECFLCL